METLRRRSFPENHNLYSVGISTHTPYPLITQKLGPGLRREAWRLEAAPSRRRAGPPPTGPRRRGRSPRRPAQHGGARQQKRKRPRWKASARSGSGAYSCSRKASGRPHNAQASSSGPGSPAAPSHAGRPPTLLGKWSLRSRQAGASSTKPSSAGPAKAAAIERGEPGARKAALRGRKTEVGYRKARNGVSEAIGPQGEEVGLRKRPVVRSLRASLTSGPVTWGRG